MTSQTPDTQAVLERLQKLERQNRRVKRMGLLALTAVGAVLVVGQAAPKTRTIEAEKFVLVDSAGKIRAELSMMLDRPSLVMLDEEGKARADLSVEPDGPRLALSNEAGKLQTELTAYKGLNGLLTYNHAGTASTLLGQGEAGPALEIFDADGKPHFRFWSTNQAPQMSFRDAGGKERAVMYLEPHSGSPSIAFYDQREKVMAAFFAGEMGPHLALNDADGNRRVELAVKDGAPTLHMQDAKGNVTWSTPTENVASTTPTSGGQRPRIFIEAWKLPGAFKAVQPTPGDFLWANVAPTLLKDSSEKMAAFAKVCPQATVTIDRQRADYTLRTQEYYEVSEDDRRGYSFGFQLFDSEGSQVGTGPEGSSLEDSLAASCKAIVSDWISKNQGRR